MRVGFGECVLLGVVWPSRVVSDLTAVFVFGLAAASSPAGSPHGTLTAAVTEAGPLSPTSATCATQQIINWEHRSTLFVCRLCSFILL